MVDKNKHSAAEGVQHLSTIPLEEWVPSYIGRNMPSKDRRATIKKRKDIQSMSGPVFMEHVMAYWLTHGAAGLISPNGLAAATSVIIKVTSEKRVSFAAQYFRNLIPHIQAKLVGDEDHKITNLDPFIKELVSEVESATNMYFSRIQGVPFRPGENNVQGGKGISKGSYGEMNQKSPGMDANQHQTAASGNLICIHHDPANGKSCRHGSACQFRHIDTREKDNKRKLEETVREIHRRKRR